MKTFISCREFLEKTAVVGTCLVTIGSAVKLRGGGSEEAHKLWTREYRKGWEPEV